MLPRHVGQEPIHHAHKWESGYQRTPVDFHEGYLDMPSAPHYGALELETVRVSLKNLRTFPCVPERERLGKLRLHGAYFAIADGTLHLLDETTGAFPPA